VIGAGWIFSPFENAEGGSVVVIGNGNITQSYPGLWAGNGTLTDPFFLDNCGPTMDEDRLTLQNIDAYLFVTNCNFDQLTLSNVSHATFDGLALNGLTITDSDHLFFSSLEVISFSSEGIRIVNSNTITLQSLDLHALHTDLLLVDCQQITFKDSLLRHLGSGSPDPLLRIRGGGNHHIENNSFEGIGSASYSFDIGGNSSWIGDNRVMGSLKLHGSSNLLNGNKITEGILWSGTNNLVVNNTMDVGGITYSGLNSVPFEENSNSVNGRSIYLWGDQHFRTLPPLAGQVILWSCSNISILDQTFRGLNIGIFVQDSSEIIVRGNVLDQNQYGSILENTSHVFAQSNFFTDNTWGLFVRYSSSLFAKGNHITNSLKIGIQIESSHQITLEVNQITNSGAIGLLLTNSTNVHVDSNHFTKKGIHIGPWERYFGANLTDDDLPQYWTSHTILQSNSIDDKPILYLKNTSGAQVFLQDYSQAIIVNSQDLEIVGANFSGGFAGLQLAYSSANRLTGNHFAQSELGLYLWKSSGNSIWGNSFISNRDDLRWELGNNWHQGYLLGGNYWSKHTSEDFRHGEIQDIIGEDGILDDPYFLNGCCVVSMSVGPDYDLFPLAAPKIFTNETIELQEPPNSILTSLGKVALSFGSVVLLGVPLLMLMFRRRPQKQFTGVKRH